MTTIFWTDNDEVIETHTAPTRKEAVAKIERMLGEPMSDNARKALIAGEEVVCGDCEAVYIR